MSDGCILLICLYYKDRRRQTLLVTSSRLAEASVSIFIPYQLFIHPSFIVCCFLVLLFVTAQISWKQMFTLWHFCTLSPHSSNIIWTSNQIFLLCKKFYLSTESTRYKTKSRYSSPHQNWKLLKKKWKLLCCKGHQQEREKTTHKTEHFFKLYNFKIIYFYIITSKGLASRI